jgi:hypothetical protein
LPSLSLSGPGELVYAEDPTKRVSEFTQQDINDRRILFRHKVGGKDREERDEREEWEEREEREERGRGRRGTKGRTRRRRSMKRRR